MAKVVRVNGSLPEGADIQNGSSAQGLLESSPQPGACLHISRNLEIGPKLVYRSSRMATSSPSITAIRKGRSNVSMVSLSLW